MQPPNVVFLDSFHLLDVFQRVASQYFSRKVLSPSCALLWCALSVLLYRANARGSCFKSLACTVSVRILIGRDLAPWQKPIALQVNHLEIDKAQRRRKRCG